jgi:hypothetical protein
MVARKDSAAGERFEEAIVDHAQLPLRFLSRCQHYRGLIGRERLGTSYTHRTRHLKLNV